MEIIVNIISNGVDYTVSNQKLRFRYLFLGFLGIGLLSFLGTYTYMVAIAPALMPAALKPAQIASDKEGIVSAGAGGPETEPDLDPDRMGRKITQATEIIREYRYVRCGHVTVGIPVCEPGLQGLTLVELKQRYREEEGWEVFAVGANRIVLRLNLEGFCPEDAAKRHLGVVDGRIAIFYGPAGFAGGLERLTDLSVSVLPAEWQQQIILGGLEFSDVESLVQALDNLDEYR